MGREGRQGQRNSKWANIRKFKETKFIATLRKAWPYGLNGKFSRYTKSTNNEIIG